MSLDSKPISSDKKPLYEASTQFINWRYSVEQLARIRASLNEAAVSAIRHTFESDEPGSSSNVLFLNSVEEQLLVKLYITKITQLCALFRFPEEVEATAVTYLKRFYLKNTVMDWHPKNVMLTALFLATKTTNNPISLETYTTHIPKTVASDILDLEFLVAQSLGFEFAVWHAHRALWGIWLDIQNLPDNSSSVSPDIYDSALKHVRASRLTDAELIYTPSQIAFAAMALAAPELASAWSHLKIAPKDSELLFPSFQDLTDAIKALIISDGQPPNIESVREVDRRLRLCKNPEKVPGTKAYLAKKAEEEKKAEGRRNKKAAISQQAMTDGDPFGNDLSKAQSALVDYDDDDDDD
ncbi:cyclin-like protein [Crucibulum laeve]|uniref:Cyclin-like protein n=1 Tax=Crucibulum laeve TaxID=68775 RepID=A0A5C3M840_9AGAR|nr:cyclin-like protein [Crucibulum laeve]